MDRLKTAISIPLIVFPVAAVIAIAIGLLLLNLPRSEEGQRLLAPLVALGMVIVATAAGFVASSRAD